MKNMKIFEAQSVQVKKDYLFWKKEGYAIKPFYIRAMDEKKARDLMVNQFPFLDSFSRNIWNEDNLSIFKELSKNEIYDLGFPLDGLEEIFLFAPSEQ